MCIVYLLVSGHLFYMEDSRFTGIPVEGERGTPRLLALRQGDNFWGSAVP